MAEKKNILCIDDGTFVEFCLSLTNYYETVYYYIDWHSNYPTFNKFVIGSEWKNGKMKSEFEHKNFVRVNNPYLVLKDVDLVFFPSVTGGNDLGDILEASGMPIFGAVKGVELEIEKDKFLSILKEHEMDVPPYEIIVGLNNLEKYISVDALDEFYVKVPRYRGDFETFKINPFNEDWKYFLSKKRSELGKLADLYTFVVQPKIDAIVEEGFDIYTVKGKYPSYFQQGCEVKDKAYACSVIERSKVSPGVDRIARQLSTVLKEYDYKGFFSTEIRTTPNKKNYLIDFTSRLGFPPNHSQQLLYGNLGEIIDKGANNIFVEPEVLYKYALEYILISEDDDRPVFNIRFPWEYRNYVKISNLFIVDGNYYSVNMNMGGCVGSVVSAGDSFEECKKQLLEVLEKVDFEGFEPNPFYIDKAIEEYYKMSNSSKS